jgi:uncharacterized membrane protein
MNTEREKALRKIFEIGIIFKGLVAVLEIVSGSLLLFVSTDVVYGLVRLFTLAEITENPTDIIATYFLQLAQSFTVGAKLFLALYLLTRGIVKLFLITGLLRNKLWAYPASIAVFGLFILYDIYRFSHTHSPFILFLGLLDLLVLWLIWHEYKVVRKVIEQ